MLDSLVRPEIFFSVFCVCVRARVWHRRHDHITFFLQSWFSYHKRGNNTFSMRINTDEGNEKHYKAQIYTLGVMTQSPFHLGSS